MRTPERMTCDVCGCDTGHLTIGKDGKPDECQRCYWSRTLDVATLTAERDSLVKQRAELEKAWDGADRDADTLRADNARHLETIRALREVCSAVSKGTGLGRFVDKRMLSEALTATADDAKKADDVKGGG